MFTLHFSNEANLLNTVCDMQRRRKLVLISANVEQRRLLVTTATGGAASDPGGLGLITFLSKLLQSYFMSDREQFLPFIVPHSDCISSWTMVSYYHLSF